MTVGVPSRYFVTAMPSSLLRNLVMEISFSSIKLPTASLSSRKPPMAVYKNLVTDTSFEARYFVIAVSLEERNLVTVTSRNLVTVMSLVSRKRVEAVPKNLVTEISFSRNFVTEMSLSARNFVTVTSLEARKWAMA